ncbi:MAG: hypothetical protein JXB62_17130 [Pirellulales bacterium]|nr:hypothetical protein [Pirellulales bacterium]
MTAIALSYHARGHRFSLALGCVLAAGAWALSVAVVSAAPAERVARPRTALEAPLVLTQIPAGTDAEKAPPVAGGMLRAPYGDGARLVVVLPDGTARVLSGRFHSACDPDVSFDATRILFAAKKTAADRWNVYEMGIDGSDPRQITRDLGDCRGPGYQSTLYTIISPKPWYQLTFVGNGAATMDEYGSTVATHLYSCKLDGSAVRRLTFNLSSDMDPFVMSDGRLLFASWQRSTLRRGLLGRVGLFGVNIDGADFALFADGQGRRIKHMPCITAGGLAVFVESDRLPWDGAGCLACVDLRRPLHTYRQITGEADGLFHSPSPLPDGRILVSRRPGDGPATHGVYRFDPVSEKAELVFDDPRFHEIQPKLIHPRPIPDGRSSVVTEEDPHGRLYCLNVYLSDLKDPNWMPPGSVKRLRVLEGVPIRVGAAAAYLPVGHRDSPGLPGSTIHGIPPLVQRRILGEIDVEADGSFNIEVPADTPIELQTLDADGMALRTCGWIWAKNHEPRGCIGCHEDPELTPENRFVDAVERLSTPLTLPPDRRRTVDFRRDVMPILTAKCAPCHRQGKQSPHFDGGLEPVEHPGGGAWFNRAYESLLSGGNRERPGRYVDAGQARTSPLIWRIFGRNTSRPWDAEASAKPVRQMPPAGAKPLGDDEKRTLVEWIDMGALWDGIPAAEPLADKGN